MQFVTLTMTNGLATVTLNRGKVNALHDLLIEELHILLGDLKKHPEVRAVILTGAGKFFSFGFDIPYFLSWSREDFGGYIKRFSQLCTDMFLWPKPIVAALNGHTIAGGCVLALTCDYRVMVPGKAKIALNEITFGASVFASIIGLLQYWLGSARSQAVLMSGAMYNAEAARELGLVDQVAADADLIAAAQQVAADLAAKDTAAFAAMKKLLRQPVVQAWQRREAESVAAFLDLWYSPATREKLKKIEIYG